MGTTSEFNNKTVLVTGGAQGMGRGVVELFAEQGAIVYAADINEEGLQAVGKVSEKITPVRLDVTKQEDFQQVIDQIVADHGRLDIIVNNAGMALAGDFNSTSMSSIEKITDVNYWSVIYGTKVAYAQMVKQGHGHIVNVASSGGGMPVPNQAMYSAIKFGVLGLSLSIREEAVHYGVKVSAVLPGMVKSELWDTAENVKGYDLKKEMGNTGMKPISPREAAEAILKGIAANDRTIIFPKFVQFVLWAYRWFPRLTTKLVISDLGKPSN